MNSFQRSNISHVGTQVEVNFENLKRKLVHATWVLLKLILLSERSQTKKERTLYGYIDKKILVHRELSSFVVTESTSVVPWVGTGGREAFIQWKLLS